MQKTAAVPANPTTLVVLMIALAFAAHAVLAAALGFSIDETYDVVMARTPALSYHDHPPAIMWLIAAAVKLAGSEDHLVVRLPTLVLAAAQTWLLYRLTALAFDRQAGLFAVLTFCLSPLFGIYFGTIAVTDGPLMFALTAAAFFAARVLLGKSPAPWRDWLLAGLCFGLAMLSKFSAILVLPGLALFLLTVPRHRRLLVTPAPYAAALVALAVFAPVLVWNFQNGLGAFAFQGSRAALGATAHVERVLAHTGFLIAAIGPAAWVAEIVALIGALRAGPRDEARWLFAMLAIVPIGFFLVLDLFGTSGDQGPHWLAPGYLFTFPLLGAAVVGLQARFPRIVWWATASWTFAVVVAMLLLVTDTATGWAQRFTSTGNYDPIVADDTDWWSLRATLEQRGLLDSRHFLVVGRYYFCFKAQLVLKDRLPVVCLSENPIALSLWHDDAALLGRDAVIITTWWRGPVSLTDLEAKFRNTETMAPAWIASYGRPVMRIDLTLGHDLKRPIFEPPAASGK
jgi:4-amino-4-deoxy-L-arabinose transferase-like glycosyltransferase